MAKNMENKEQWNYSAVYSDQGFPEVGAPFRE